MAGIAERVSEVCDDPLRAAIGLRRYDDLRDLHERLLERGLAVHDNPEKREFFQPELSGWPTNNFSNAYRVDSDARTLSVTGAHVCSSRPPTASLTLHLGGSYAGRMSMPERLVDIKAGERLLHTFPVTTRPLQPNPDPLGVLAETK